MAHITKALFFRISRFLNKLGGGGNKLHGIGLLHRLQNVKIVGTNNTIDVKSRLPKDVRIFIYGNNHHLIVEENVTFKKGLIWFEDHNCEIYIGAGTTIEEAELSVAENGTKITICKDCMFSKGVHITTTDSHSIISIETGQRTNPAKNIEIRDHVWLGYNVNVNKRGNNRRELGCSQSFSGNQVYTRQFNRCRSTCKNSKNRYYLGQIKNLSVQ